MTMDIDRIFGPPQPLTELQMEFLRKLQEDFHALACSIIANTQNVPQREMALNSLAEAYAAAKAAAKAPRSLITPDVLANAFLPTEERDTVVRRMWVNVRDWAEIRKYGRDIVETESSMDKIRQHIYGRIWGAEIHIRKGLVPEGFVIPIGEDEGDADLAPDWQPKPDQLVRL